MTKNTTNMIQNVRFSWVVFANGHLNVEICSARDYVMFIMMCYTLGIVPKECYYRKPMSEWHIRVTNGNVICNDETLYAKGSVVFLHSKLEDVGGVYPARFLNTDTNCLPIVKFSAIPQDWLYQEAKRQVEKLCADWVKFKNGEFAVVVFSKEQFHRFAKMCIKHNILFGAGHKRWYVADNEKGDVLNADGNVIYTHNDIGLYYCHLVHVNDKEYSYLDFTVDESSIPVTKVLFSDVFGYTGTSDIDVSTSIKTNKNNVSMNTTNNIVSIAEDFVSKCESSMNAGLELFDGDIKNTTNMINIISKLNCDKATKVNIVLATSGHGEEIKRW